MEVLNVGRADQSDFTSIDTSSLKDWPPPHASISIPQKEFEIFTANDALTTLATTYRNVSVLFPVGRQKVERYLSLSVRLISLGILSICL